MTRSEGRRDRPAGTSAAIATALDDERRRIGEELHDGLQHRIVAALLCVRMLEREVDRGDDRWRDLLAQAGEGLAASLAELRCVLVDARPPVDLASEVRALAGNSPLSVRVTAGELPLVSARAARTVFRVTAEALTNTMKHAGAGSAEVYLEADKSDVRVCVRDDGRGFATRPSAGTAAAPAALRRLVTRAGGTLHVGTSTSGTVVTAAVPRTLR